ncbi:MAG: leucine-rich repeat protein, partial [Treponema sp.]|nr:leucine-rich repeat protein [Treponema sp.]
MPLLFFTACPNLTNEPDKPTVTSVTVSPVIAAVAKGATQQFTATVNGTSNPGQTVTWTVEGSGTGTIVSSSGFLSVAVNETATALIVRATSTVDTGKSGTAIVTISSGGVPTVTSVTVSPATAAVVKGATQQFTATVNGTSNPGQTVTWTVEGGVTGTSISSSGLLSIDANETAATLTVKATSTVDTSKSGTASVTVYASNDELPTVTSVTVSPATAAVAKGATQQFTATVNGTSNPGQTVTWTVEGGGAGTSVSSDGLLSVGTNETAATLTVKATSTVDSSKSGTASVTISGNDGRNLITSIAEVQTYLSAASNGATAADPVSLDVRLNLADTSDGWTALLDAIQTANKFVALNLSACTLSGTEFDPGETATGESKIVSLVLPNTAKSIKGTYDKNSSFKNFTALTSVSGSAVETIGFGAFMDCTTLTSVSLPQATSIGDYAFASCTALTSVSLPAATSISDGAFYSCTALTSVSLPAATSIGDYAFVYCAALTSVSLPTATSIGDGAFSSCDALTSVSLPATLITINGNPFSGCINLATITVASGNLNYSAQDNMLLNKAGTTLIAYPSA